MPIKLAKTAARFVGLVVAIIAALWIYRGYLARGLPELQVWHTHKVESEFREEDFPDGISFYQYKELEEQLSAAVNLAFWSK